MKILELPAYFFPENMSSSHLDDNLREAFAIAGIDMAIYCPMPTRGITAEVRKEYKRRKRKRCMMVMPPYTVSLCMVKGRIPSYGLCDIPLLASSSSTGLYLPRMQGVVM